MQNIQATLWKRLQNYTGEVNFALRKIILPICCKITRQCQYIVSANLCKIRQTIFVLKKLWTQIENQDFRGICTKDYVESYADFIGIFYHIHKVLRVIVF